MKVGFQKLKETIAIRLWSFINVPLLYQMKPKVFELSDEKAIICIPFKRKNKNHLNSLYMGSLVGGADLACGVLAQHLIKKRKKDISIIFKSIEAQFIKRLESDAYFVCNESHKIIHLIEKALQTGKRQSGKIKVTAHCPDKFSSDILANFTLSLSVKDKKTVS